VVLMALPLPEALVQLAPPEPAQLQFTPVIAAGTVSLKLAPERGFGPTFCTVTV